MSNKKIMVKNYILSKKSMDLKNTPKHKIPANSNTIVIIFLNDKFV